MLFLNVSPLTLATSNDDKCIVKDILKKFEISHKQVVIELSEKYPLEDYQVVSNAMKYYRRHGFKIAIDDLGSGCSGLRVWSQLAPDYVKIDQYFIRDIHNSPIKPEFVRSIQEISKSLHCDVVAEGLESQEELSVVRAMGVSHGQGFLLGEPSDIASTKEPKIVQSSEHIPQLQVLDADNLLSEILIKSLALSDEATLAHAADMFFQHKSLIAIPVLKGQESIGLLMRESILELFLERYHQHVDIQQPVIHYMNNCPMIIEKIILIVRAKKCCSTWLIMSVTSLLYSGVII